jgi:hypothetical protein
MKKYLVEFTLNGSDKIMSVTYYAKNFDGAYSAATEIRNLNTLLTIKEL